MSMKSNEVDEFLDYSTMIVLRSLLATLSQPTELLHIQVLTRSRSGMVNVGTVNRQ